MLKINARSLYRIVGLSTTLVIMLLFLGQFTIASAATTHPIPTDYVRYFPIMYKNHYVDSWIGPYGGKISALANTAQDSNVLYAGTWGSGVFKSTNGGDGWQSVSSGLGKYYIQSLAVDPTNSQNVYAGTYKKGLYRSVNGGETWLNANQGIQDGAVVYSIAVDPVEPWKVYASTRGVSDDGTEPWKGVIYKSGDYGASWSVCKNDIGGNSYQDWAYSLAINPSNHNQIYAATHRHGPYVSNDGGSSWDQIDDGASDVGRTIGIALSNPSTLFYGAWGTTGVDTRGGIYLTTDGGDDWKSRNSGIDGVDIYTLAVDPQNPGTVYASAYGSGIIKTTNSGEDWDGENTGFNFTEYIFSLAIDKKDPSIVFTGTGGDGLYRSTNSAASWQSANTGLSGNPITSVVYLPETPSTLVASLYLGGVFVSTDNGSNWQNITGNLANIGVHGLIVSPSNTNNVYALTEMNGVYKIKLNEVMEKLSKSTGGDSDTGEQDKTVETLEPGEGIQWADLNSGLPTVSLLDDDYELSFEEGHPLYGQSVSEDMKLMSIENIDLDQKNSYSRYRSMISMTFDPLRPNNAYLGTSGSGAYRSTDGGGSWSGMGLDGYIVYSLAVDYNSTTPTVYAATNGSHSLKYTTNNGDDWENSNLPDSITVYSLAFSTIDKTTLYAATSNGIYKKPSGSGWSCIGYCGTSMTTVALHPNDAKIILAGNSAGTYITRNGGGNWSLLSSMLSGVPVQTITIDPLSTTDGFYFIGTITHGLFRSPYQFK